MRLNFNILALVVLLYFIFRILESLILQEICPVDYSRSMGYNLCKVQIAVSCWVREIGSEKFGGLPYNFLSRKLWVLPLIHIFGKKIFAPT